jgi:hypothetical protein
MRVPHYFLLTDYPVKMRTMLAAAPFRWTDPATWPWMFYVWLAFIFATWSFPGWRWLRRKRAAGWPVADGRIESVEVSKPSFSFMTKRGYYVADLGYSYSVAGTLNSGRYKRDFPTEQEAEEFVRDLQGKAMVVHYNPGKPSSSALLAPDIEVVLQHRAPAPVPDSASAANSVPDWIRPFLWFLICFSAVGLFVSLWVHLGAVMGKRVAPEACFFMLHIGIFVVWIPAILVAQRLVGNVNRRDLWKVVLKDSPDWMRYMVYGFGGYAILNFLLFMTKAPSGGNGNPPAIVWRGFSGHWMAFYSAALAILYAAARTENTSPRCANGHVASSNAAYCPQCGQPVLRVR